MSDDTNEIVLTLPKPLILDKHLHYAGRYKPNDIYWGIGIEREFYLQSSKVRTVSRKWICDNQRPERYSVRYFQSYKSGAEVNKAINNIYGPNDSIDLPILFNSHALYRVDCKGNHQTTYEREPKPNSAFKGKVLFEYLMEHNGGKNFFVQNYERGLVFDGDSIELITQNFYKVCAEDVVDEMQRLCHGFIYETNAALGAAKVMTEHLPLRWATDNHGLALMWTNPGNVAIFNNGTYHINLTAPTRLDGNGVILDRADFIRRHKKMIRFFQWIEPLLICIYGSGDVFARKSGGFSNGSLRCAMSRYIGVGTYDNVTMANGKTLSVARSEVPVGGRDGWYTLYHSGSQYVELAEIGLDILFNKHYNHGIELRVFDWFPENRLYELLRILILSMDQALSVAEIPDPRTNRIWNKVTARAISEGGRLKLWKNEQLEFARALGLGIKGFEIKEIWASLCKLLEKWTGRGECARRMLRLQPGCCVA
jgi:hypothetical protein